jgi:hypothetical protein
VGNRGEENREGSRPAEELVVSEKQRTRAHWKDEPDEHDYPAAQDYLSLLFPEQVAGPLVEALRGVEKVERKGKDLLRASRLALLAADDPHVAKDLTKVSNGELLSPVLLVRGNGKQSIPLIVADGYHRICASYHLDEDADIPCRLIDLS